jgi:hypothetical protein
MRRPTETPEELTPEELRVMEQVYDAYRTIREWGLQQNTSGYLSSIGCCIAKPRGIGRIGTRAAVRCVPGVQLLPDARSWRRGC